MAGGKQRMDGWSEAGIMGGARNEVGMGGTTKRDQILAMRRTATVVGRAVS